MTSVQSRGWMIVKTVALCGVTIFVVTFDNVESEESEEFRFTPH